jgi:hypothetical protein
MAMPHRAVRVLATGWTVPAGVAIARWPTVQWIAAGCSLRRFRRWAFARKLSQPDNIGWMTYCLGQEWTSAPPGPFRALVLRMIGRLPPVFGWGVRRFAVCGVPGRVPECRFLSSSRDMRGVTAPRLGTGGQLADFSMSAYIAGF